MEVMYVVTYRPEIGKPITCKVMNGNELANMYGFSDCTGVEIKRVFEVNKDGNLEIVALRDNRKPPYNWLCIQNMENMKVDMYTWNEH